MPTFTECIDSVLLFDYVTKSLIRCMTRHYNPNSYTSDCLIQFLPKSGPDIPRQWDLTLTLIDSISSHKLFLLLLFSNKIIFLLLFFLKKISSWTGRPNEGSGVRCARDGPCASPRSIQRDLAYAQAAERAGPCASCRKFWSDSGPAHVRAAENFGDRRPV